MSSLLVKLQPYVLRRPLESNEDRETLRLALRQLQINSSVDPAQMKPGAANESFKVYSSLANIAFDLATEASSAKDLHALFQPPNRSDRILDANLYSNF